VAKKPVVNQGIYYFIGNIPSHALHALPLWRKMGGTFVVLSKKTEKALSLYKVPVLRLQNSPRLMLDLSKGIEKTMAYLEQHAQTIIFYEIYKFSDDTRLKKPTTYFLSHGNMIKDHMGEMDRVSLVNKNYDYMAALGPTTKAMFLEAGIEKSKLLDVGVARTDEIVQARKNYRDTTLTLIKKYDYHERQKVIVYTPTYWGVSSIYETGKDLVKLIDDDYFLLVRLHPQTRRSIVRSYKKLCSKKSNVFLTNDTDTPGLGLIQLFSAADVVISDVSSVMLEAILLDVPLVFAYGHGRHRQQNTSYEPIKKITEYSMSLEEHNSTIPNKVIAEALIKNINPSLWSAAKNEVFFNSDGTSVKSIKEAILSTSR